MRYKLLFRVAKVFQALGFAVLRFNFRGVGLSEGTHDDGKGEQDDVRAALDWLERELPGYPVVAGGFSFGSVMGLRVGGRDPRVAGLLALGLPVDGLPRTRFVEAITKPKLFIQGELDQFGNAAAIESLLERVPPRERSLFYRRDRGRGDGGGGLGAASDRELSVVQLEITAQHRFRAEPLFGVASRRLA